MGFLPTLLLLIAFLEVLHQVLLLLLHRTLLNSLWELIPLVTINFLFIYFLFIFYFFRNEFAAFGLTVDG